MIDQELQPWSSLTAAEQIELRADYQQELEHQPLTCSLDEKVERFSSWLAHRGISFKAEDLRSGKSN